MKVPLHIETHDRRLAFDIVGSTSLKSGTAVDAPGGIRLDFDGALIRKSVGIPEVLQFIVNASVNVELALFASWLYDKVKDRQVERITVRDTIVTVITKDAIRQALTREIERQLGP
jgi:hypothetical protein